EKPCGVEEWTVVEVPWECAACCYVYCLVDCCSRHGGHRGPRSSTWCRGHSGRCCCFFGGGRSHPSPRLHPARRLVGNMSARHIGLRADQGNKGEFERGWRMDLSIRCSRTCHRRNSLVVPVFGATDES
ncbi:unnamed protein product, partial [Prorocentrum cordatum]